MLKFTTAQVEEDSTSQPVWRPLREEAASPLFTTFSLQLIIFFCPRQVMMILITKK